MSTQSVRSKPISTRKKNNNNTLRNEPEFGILFWHLHRPAVKTASAHSVPHDFNQILSSYATTAPRFETRATFFFRLSFFYSLTGIISLNMLNSTLRRFSSSFCILFYCIANVCVSERSLVRHSFGTLKSKVLWVIHRSNKFSLQRPQPMRDCTYAVWQTSKVSPLFEMNLIFCFSFLFALYG